MRVAALVPSAIALLASAVLADIDSINKPTGLEEVPAGAAYTIEWAKIEGQPTGPVTIRLVGGPTHPEGLVNIGEPLATGYDNDLLKFSWTVDSSLGTDTFYGIHITLDSNPSSEAWSQAFHIVGGTGGNSSSSTTGGPSSTSGGASSTSAPSSTVVPSSSYSSNTTTTSSSSSVSTTFEPTTTGKTNTTVTSTSTKTPTTSSTSTTTPPVTAPNAAGRLNAGAAGALGLFGLLAFLL